MVDIARRLLDQADARGIEIPLPTDVVVAKEFSAAAEADVKAVSDVIAPLSGEIIEVNVALSDNPAMINEDPYGEGWLVKVRLSDPAESEALMDSSSYKATLGG